MAVTCRGSIGLKAFIFSLFSITSRSNLKLLGQRKRLHIFQHTRIQRRASRYRPFLSRTPCRRNISLSFARHPFQWVSHILLGCCKLLQRRKNARNALRQCSHSFCVPSAHTNSRDVPNNFGLAQLIGPTVDNFVLPCISGHEEEV